MSKGISEQGRAKSHHGLPSGAVWARTLQHVGRTEVVVSPLCATTKAFTCSISTSTKRVQWMPRGLNLSTWAEQTIVHDCAATRCGAAWVTMNEQARDTMRALTQGRAKPHGHVAHECVTFLAQANIKVDVAPGTSHARMGIIAQHAPKKAKTLMPLSNTRGLHCFMTCAYQVCRSRCDFFISASTQDLQPMLDSNILVHLLGEDALHSSVHMRQWRTFRVLRNTPRGRQERCSGLSPRLPFVLVQPLALLG